MTPKQHLPLKPDRIGRRKRLLVKRNMGSARIEAAIDIKLTEDGDVQAEIVDAAGDIDDWGLNTVPEDKDL